MDMQLEIYLEMDIQMILMWFGGHSNIWISNGESMVADV